MALSSVRLTVACGLGLVTEHAYRLTQQLDPRSEGRGVLQFKTGLKSIIKVVILFFLNIFSHSEVCESGVVNYRGILVM